MLDIIQKESNHLRGMSLFMDKSQNIDDAADQFLEQFINDFSEDINIQSQRPIKISIIIDTL